MAHAHTVVLSVNLDAETRCVDVFRRPDGSYGFDEFRRDPEDPTGWFSIGHYGDRWFPSQEAAVAAARKVVAGFKDFTGQ